jgi:hypothetical protein
MKRAIAVIALLGLLSFAVPAAVGAPSPLAVAKKALRLAKKANGAAKKANEAIKRSANATHATEVRLVDSGAVAAPPSGFARFSVPCASYEVPTAVNVQPGALDVVYAGVDGQSGIASFFNPSSTSWYNGSIQVACIWAARGATPASARAGSGSDARAEMRSAERARKQATRVD